MILLTNDDGYDAPGLTCLARELVLVEGMDVVIVAPKENRSGSSHSLSLDKTKPILVETILDQPCPTFAVSGTPADAAHLGARVLFATRPVLVISGINHGANFGFDLYHSGTIGAAREAAIYGVPAIAFSHDSHLNEKSYDYKAIARTAAWLIRELKIATWIKEGEFLNVNFPKKLGRVGAAEIPKMDVCRTRLAHCTWGVPKFCSLDTPIHHVRGFRHCNDRVIRKPEDPNTDYHVTRILQNISISQIRL